MSTNYLQDGEKDHIVYESSKWMPTGVNTMNENGGKRYTEEFNEEVRWGLGTDFRFKICG